MKNEVNKDYTPDPNSEAEVSEPSLYQVRVHNDDFTPMEFVVDVLQRFFYMDRITAAGVMMEAHVKGYAICGAFSKDIAETKVSQVEEYARLNEHPLICSMEEER